MVWLVFGKFGWFLGGFDGLRLVSKFTAKILGGFESNNSATKAVAASEYDATDVLDKISFEYSDGNNHLLTYFEHYTRGKESEDIRNFIILCCSGYVLPTQQIKV